MPYVPTVSNRPDQTSGLGTLEQLVLSVAPSPDGVPQYLWNRAIVEPLIEFTSRPGKQFRGKLVTLAWQLAGREDLPPVTLPPIVELLHAGSLIVDDIEDNSIQRRGRAALHRQIGLPLALNLGNWLYFWPLGLLNQLELPSSVVSELHRYAIETIQHCHEGQALDLAGRIGDLHPSDIYPVVLAISQRKTGSLLALSAAFGAIAAEADPTRTQAIMTFGEKLGVALQMQNDLSELTGAAGPLKHPEDLVHGRVTWPWAWASQRLSAARFDSLQARGESLTLGVGDASALARELLQALGDDPSQHVREWLGAAFDELSHQVPEGPALQAIRTEITRLENKYSSSPRSGS